MRVKHQHGCKHWRSSVICKATATAKHDLAAGTLDPSVIEQIYDWLVEQPEGT
jgi:hypothetical protein